ncbi:MAG: glycosyltransferase family 4 protein [Chthoniobacterales bacterium]
MILFAHPFGNANVRAVLNALQEANQLARFLTTVGYSKRAPFLSFLPKSAGRRAYDLPAQKIRAYPAREMVRLLAGALRIPVRHEHGWASIDQVWAALDGKAARYLSANKQQEQIGAVYAYEDCALRSFTAARALGVRRIYDLPIAYYETAQRILREEAERYPDWEPTLGGTRDSKEKLARKKRELELAELVICPSNFVLDSLPERARQEKQCVMAPFGSPVSATKSAPSKSSAPLRVLFAGALTQRKGLADLFAAMRLIDSANVELVVMGSLLRPLSWYREQFPNFRYEPPRPHGEVLRLMGTCDVFVLPSLVEGRALVQQEAMASGLPLIATRNAGGDDLIEDGETGFLVPIRSPEALAEKINWCAGHRERICGMGIAAQRRAAQLSWRGYGETILAAIQALTGI